MHCIVLMGLSLLPIALRPFFKIYGTPPNLGITRTWIFQLSFAQRPIISGLRFFNESEILCSGFLRPQKNPSTSAGFEPANLGSRGEHVTLRPTSSVKMCDVVMRKIYIYLKHVQKHTLVMPFASHH